MGREVKLPPSLLYPIEIVALLAPASSPVKRHDRLIKFKYWNRVPDGVAEEGEEPPLVTREFYGHFDSPHEGQLQKWLVKPGDRLNDNLTAVFIVEEGCDHSVQFGGLCALCGRSLDDKDYMGYSDVDRAPIAMSHDTAGLTVSREEAERIETNSTTQLLKSNRLVLVVDLDQTVIHASVSPEIGKWVEDPESPQHEAVKDVKSFVLKERGQQSWYFVKLRPGLSEFLEQMCKLYEMHIYTMATKQYALEIAKLIDPEGKFFADRILSRDASGDLLRKNLQRLFPVSTQMVTIIDDRGDVWGWVPNLVRVVPYQFWSNTGDINSQFLPKRSGLVTPDTIESEEGNEAVATHDKDQELRNIGLALSKLHSRFYKAYEPGLDLPDVGLLLPVIKSRVFDGCVLLFSGFFPLGTTDLDSADIVQWVRSFGAVVLADFLPSVTHVVARNSGTVKARQAAGHNKVVVGIEWVFKCLETWEHAPEEPFKMVVANPIAPGAVVEELGQEETENLDPAIADQFVRSIQRGDVNWEAMDAELNELLQDEEGDEDDYDENENENNEEERSPRDNKDEDFNVQPANEKLANEKLANGQPADVAAANDKPENDEPENDKADTTPENESKETNSLKRRWREDEAGDNSIAETLSEDEFGLDEDWD